MTRRGIPTQINWFLREWMEITDAFSGRGGLERMRKETGWSKATMSQLYNNKQDYSPKILNEAARALHVEPFELLMKPERAMALRRQVAAAIQIVADNTPPEDAPPNKAGADKKKSSHIAK